MLVIPAALALGASGLLARGHPRIVLCLAVGTPIASVLAMAAQLVPGAVESCSSTTAGTTTCQGLAAVSAWSGPLPPATAAGLLVLSFGPLAGLRSRSPWPAATSALIQCFPQVISFGGFLDWAPALALTVAVAFALLPKTSRARPAR